jgi:outer membrane lipoprotein-sorting protein
VLAAFLFTTLLGAKAASALTSAETIALLEEIDDRQRNSGDWKARMYIDQKEKNKNDIVYDGVYYRRDADDKLMILFLRPKSERGKGYLRLRKNLWFYDPRVGKWERRTERERIGGTGSNRQDFDESRLSSEYHGKHTGDARLGRYKAYVLTLRAKKGVDVAYPKIKMWVDQATKNVLKRQDFAASGKLLRSVYYPKWKKVFSPSKKADVWYPKQIRIFDEIEKANRTTIVIREVDLRSLPLNIFTKAWLESKSR